MPATVFVRILQDAAGHSMEVDGEGRALRRVTTSGWFPCDIARFADYGAIRRTRR
jgi:hypothetical protein